MQGKAILCRPRSGAKSRRPARDERDAARLRAADALALSRQDFARALRAQARLRRLDRPAARARRTIGLLENEWNDFDRLTPRTKLLHNTQRRTQPWKTGLPVDFVPGEKLYRLPAIGGALMRRGASCFGDYALLGHYVRHPDPNQERFFFGLLRECVEKRHRQRGDAARGDAPQPRPPRRLRGDRRRRRSRHEPPSGRLAHREREERRARAPRRGACRRAVGAGPWDGRHRRARWPARWRRGSCWTMRMSRVSRSGPRLHRQPVDEGLEMPVGERDVLRTIEPASRSARAVPRIDVLPSPVS